MAEASDGVKTVDERLGSVEKHVTDLRGEVGGLRGEVGELRGEVQKLRVLAEHTASEVKLVAEVQGHHSKQLLEIATALEPLAEMHAFFKLVAGDHEHRIKALEGREESA